MFKVQYPENACNVKNLTLFTIQFVLKSAIPAITNELKLDKSEFQF